MKRKLTILIAILGVTAFTSSSFATDEVVHAIVDAATGAHHQRYYSYDRGGYDDGYYGQRYYRQTNYQGGHHHHDEGVASFSLRGNHGHDSDHDRGHGRGHDHDHDRGHHHHHGHDEH